MSKAGDNTAAGLGVALAAVNPFVGALYSGVNFLFGGGGFSVDAMRLSLASNRLADLARAAGIRLESAPPVGGTGKDYGAVWQSTRDFYASKNYPAQVGLPSSPPPEFVAAWNAQDATKNPGAADVGWGRYAQILSGLRAKGYQDVPWQELFANQPSDTKKAGDYLGLAVSMAPAVFEWLKPAAQVKPIPTGGPNPGVPQLAFVGAIPEIVVTTPRVIAPAVRLVSPFVRGAIAALGLGLAADTVSKGPPTRGRPGRIRPAPAPEPLPLRNPPLKPVEWPYGLDYTRPPLQYPPMPEIVTYATRLPTLALPELLRGIPELVVRAKRLRRPKATRMPRIRLPRGQEVQELAQRAAEATLARQLQPLRQSARYRTGARVSAALASALAPSRISPTTPARPSLGTVRWPVPGLSPALQPGRPIQLGTQTATATQPATKDCRCTCTDTSPQAQRRRKEQRERRKKRRCFSSTRALNDYIRNRTKGK